MVVHLHLHLLALRAHAVLVEVATLKATTTLLVKPALNVIHLLKQVVVGTMPEAARYIIPKPTSRLLSQMVRNGRTVRFFLLFHKVPLPLAV